MRVVLKIISEAIKYFCIFIINYIWLNFFIKNILWSIIICSTLSLLLLLILNKIFNIKSNKVNLKSLEMKNAQNYANQLLFYSNFKIINLFYNNLKSSNNIEKHKSYLLIIKEDKENILIYPDFTNKKIEEKTIVTAINLAQKEKVRSVLILCKSYNYEIKNFYKNIPNMNITIYDEFLIYKNFYKKYNFYPENIIEFNEKSKYKIGELITFAFKKEKAKNYFFASIIVLLWSVFTPYKLYYFIVSTILLIMFLYCKFFKNNSKTGELDL